MHQSGRLQAVFGLRGVIGFELTVYGPTRPLHSGHYGNWAPNPGALIANLIASMRDDDGRVKVAGFYDDDPAKIGMEIAGRRVIASPDILAYEIDTGSIEALWPRKPVVTDLGVGMTDHSNRSLIRLPRSVVPWRG